MPIPPDLLEGRNNAAARVAFAKAEIERLREAVVHAMGLLAKAEGVLCGFDQAIELVKGRPVVTTSATGQPRLRRRNLHGIVSEYLTPLMDADGRCSKADINWLQAKMYDEHGLTWSRFKPVLDYWHRKNLFLVRDDPEPEPTPEPHQVDAEIGPEIGPVVEAEPPPPPPVYGLRAPILPGVWRDPDRNRVAGYDPRYDTDSTSTFEH